MTGVSLRCQRPKGKCRMSSSQNGRESSTPLQIGYHSELGAVNHSGRERLWGVQRRVGAALQQALQLRPGLLPEAPRQEAAAQLRVPAQEAQRSLHCSYALILYMSI